MNGANQVILDKKCSHNDKLSLRTIMLLSLRAERGRRGCLNLIFISRICQLMKIHKKNIENVLLFPMFYIFKKCIFN